MATFILSHIGSIFPPNRRRRPTDINYITEKAEINLIQPF